MVEGTLPLSKETATGATVFIQGVGLAPVSVPLHTVYLCCGLVTGLVVVGARPSLPVQGLLGNDLASSRVIPDLSVTNEPELTEDVDKLKSIIYGFFPACTVTRVVIRQTASQSSGDIQSDNGGPIHQAAGAVVLRNAGDGEDIVSVEATECSREQLIQAQEDGVELCLLMNDAVGEEEVHKYAYCFFWQFRIPFELVFGRTVRRCQSFVSIVPVVQQTIRRIIGKPTTLVGTRIQNYSDVMNNPRCGLYVPFAWLLDK